MLIFFEKAINQSCFFGGLPFHWNRKKNQISLPLDRRDVIRWSIAAINELCFTVFVIFRTISTRSEKIDELARLRVTCLCGFYTLFGSIHVYYFFRREQAAELVNLFVGVFKQWEGIQL